ncbi:MAG TPA: hypothetical protein VI911_00610 [Patescibacteria group bacterium]|nr:hypothetical protein [Patescibacteria group bacterium]
MKEKKKFSLVENNIKVDALIWNLPAIITCKANLECHKYCYCKKDKRFPSVEVSRTNNLQFSKSTDFVNELTNAIKSNKKHSTVRLHASGDFYSVQYISDWYKIISNCPEVTFYAYTKRDDLFTKEILAEKPNNLTLIFSVDGLFETIQDIPNIDVPQGYNKIAFVTKNDTNCVAQKDDDKKCISGCKKCLKSCKENIIVFKKH